MQFLILGVGGSSQHPQHRRLKCIQVARARGNHPIVDARDQGVAIGGTVEVVGDRGRGGRAAVVHIRHVFPDLGVVTNHFVTPLLF